METSQGDEEGYNEMTGGHERLARAGGHAEEGWGPSDSELEQGGREGGRSRPMRSSLERGDFRQEKEVTGKRIICGGADLMRGKARRKGRGKQISSH